MTWGILGHKEAIELLKLQIQRDQVSHAYLFTGPAGVGRRTLALRFAKAVNCQQSTQPGEPCGKCRTCVQIEAMQHTDLTIVRKPEDRTRILIDQIRELQRSAILTPYESKYRIALCLNFEEATEDAQNAFLKTLEEAPTRVILLITAESPDALLPTIVSRCEVLRLRPMPVTELEELLRSREGITLDDVSHYAHFAQGCPGRALALFNDPSLYEMQIDGIQNAIRLLQSTLVERFRFAEQVTKRNTVDLPTLFRIWITLWSDLLDLRAGTGNHIVNVELSDELYKLAQKLDLNTIKERLVQQQKAWRSLDRYANARLLVEVLLLDWPMV